MDVKNAKNKQFLLFILFLYFVFAVLSYQLISIYFCHIYLFLFRHERLYNSFKRAAAMSQSLKVIVKCDVLDLEFVFKKGH